MAALKSTSTFLHIGDRISLFHEPSNGYVGAEGFANVLVACDPSDGKVSDDKTRNEARRAAHRCPRSRPAPAQRGPLCPQVRDAIFVVHQMANYSVAKQLKAYLEKNGMTLQEAQGEPRCRALLQQKAKEDALNEEEFESSTGREVRYGMIVQLQHDTSQQNHGNLCKQPCQSRSGCRLYIHRGRQQCCASKAWPATCSRR